jgi:hypothetical protein
MSVQPNGRHHAPSGGSRAAGTRRPVVAKATRYRRIGGSGVTYRGCPRFRTDSSTVITMTPACEPIVAEVRLRHLAILDHDLCLQRGRQAEDDAASIR